MRKLKICPHKVCLIVRERAKREGMTGWGVQSGVVVGRQYQLFDAQDLFYA